MSLTALRTIKFRDLGLDQLQRSFVGDNSRFHLEEGNRTFDHYHRSHDTPPGYPNYYFPLFGRRFDPVPRTPKSRDCRWLSGAFRPRAISPRLKISRIADARLGSRCVNLNSSRAASS